VRLRFHWLLSHFRSPLCCSLHIITTDTNTSIVTEESRLQLIRPLPLADRRRGLIEAAKPHSVRTYCGLHEQRSLNGETNGHQISSKATEQAWNFSGYGGRSSAPIPRCGGGRRRDRHTLRALRAKSTTTQRTAPGGGVVEMVYTPLMVKCIFTSFSMTFRQFGQ
jgi:hypothetical protein